MLEPRSAAAAGVEREPIRDATTHVLKCWTVFYTEIAEGRKRHDLRRATDRDFRVGDRLRLLEFDPARERYTGREQVVAVTYITSADLPCALSEEALNPDFCILSIAPLPDA
jgi:hypothetical protein